MNKPKRPEEQGTIEENIKVIAFLREKALISQHTEIAVALTHNIAWLNYLTQLENFYNEKVQ